MAQKTNFMKSVLQWMNYNPFRWFSLFMILFIFGVIIFGGVEIVI